MPEIAGGAAILCGPADPASIAEALVAGVARAAIGCAIWGFVGRASSPGRPSADGDKHGFLVNRPSLAPPELHTGARSLWQAA
jgi:hypothetical protein